MYKIIFLQTDTNKVRLIKAFDTKKEAKKVMRDLEKAGRIERRGYDYFSASFRNLEVRNNY